MVKWTSQRARGGFKPKGTSEEVWENTIILELVGKNKLNTGQLSQLDTDGNS